MKTTEKTDKTDQIYNDPVLRSFHVTDAENKYRRVHIYDMSFFFTPVSIKDQIVRVCLILDRLHELKHIKEGHKLLIVGGGPAGLTAAIKASLKGIKVTLIERATNLGGKIASVPREFCPTQYEWVSKNWAEGKFPLDEKDTSFSPVQLTAGQAKDLSIRLKERLDDSKCLKNYIELLSTEIDINRLEIHKNSTPTDKTKHDTLEIGFKPGPPPYKPDDDAPADLRHEYEKKKIEYDGKVKMFPDMFPDGTEIFDMVLVCAGFPKENTTCGTYSGPSFWDLSTLDMDRYTKDPSKRILVCGTGDGAIQDFLMLATKSHLSTAKALYQTVIQQLSDEKLQSKIEFILLNEELEAKRKELWQRGPAPKLMSQECGLYHNLHQIYEELVDEIVGDPKKGIPENTNATALLDQVISDIARNGNIHVVMQCGHFTACYALNHFLGLLLIRFLERKFGHDILKENRSVLRTGGIAVADETIDHICREKFSECAKIPHKVILYGSSCGEPFRTEEENRDPEQTYDTIFIRFGIKRFDNDSENEEDHPVFPPGPALPGLQMVPYAFP